MSIQVQNGIEREGILSQEAYSTNVSLDTHALVTCVMKVKCNTILIPGIHLTKIGKINYVYKQFSCDINCN